MPLDLAVLSHSSNGHARAVLYGREFVGIAPWGVTINTARGLSSQGLMGTLAVILLYEKVTCALLSSVGWLGPNIVFKSSMHPFMAPVLAWLPGLIRSGRMPSWIHHFDNSLTPPTESEANGAPLSVRMARGSPYCRKALSNHGRTTG